MRSVFSTSIKAVVKHLLYIVSMLAQYFGGSGRQTDNINQSPSFCDRSESTKLANRWPATVGGHDWVCILFDVHARSSNDLFLLLIVRMFWFSDRIRILEHKMNLL
jgi:hypothetical protein